MTGERNYHIFYDLLSGKSGSDSSLCLDPSPMEYFYLNQSVEEGKVAEGGEKGMFEHVCHAMEVIGIEEEQQGDMWKVLSGILHLGNTTIIEADTVEGLKAAVEVSMMMMMMMMQITGCSRVHSV
jgi:myosin heavy subunit